MKRAQVLLEIHKMDIEVYYMILYGKYSSFAPLIYSKDLIPEELIRIEGVNRDGYIIFFQVI